MRQRVGIGCGILLLLCVGLSFVRGAIGGDARITTTPVPAAVAAPRATVPPTPAPTFTPFNPAPVVATLEAAQVAEDWLLASDMADVLLKADPHNERLQDIRANALMMVGDKAMMAGDTREAARRWEMAQAVKPHPVIEERLRMLTPPATATNTPEPPATEIPTAAPAFVADFDLHYRPQTLGIGEKLVFELRVTNRGPRTIRGFKSTATGPWGDYTIASVIPGYYDHIIGPHYFMTDMEVPPGELRVLTIVAYPNKPGNETFSFSLEDSSGTPIVNPSGQSTRFRAPVAVHR